MISFSEKLLAKLSHPSEAVAQEQDSLNKWTIKSALDTLQRVYPDLLQLIKDKKIFNLGYGPGNQSITIALALHGARSVAGINSNKTEMEAVDLLSRKYKVMDKVSFYNSVSQQEFGKFDLVISQNSMEHINDPEEKLRFMKSLLNPAGKILISFGPPWFAPYGSHMKYFTNVPWVNILFPEKTVMRVRSRYRDDGARHYEDVEFGLNKMTLAKFERLIKTCGMKITHRKYEAVKRLNFLTGVPGVRELMTNHVTCVLEKIT